MLILIDKTSLRMVAAAATRKWINLVSYVDFPNIESIIVDGMEGKTWSALDRAQMATLYTNMSGQPAPEYNECIAQLSSYAQTWPPYPKSMEDLEVEAERIYQEEVAEGLHPQPGVESKETRASHQAIITMVENANAALSPEDRAAAAAAQPKAVEKAPRDSSEPQARPRQGQTKRIWEIADDLLAVVGTISNMKEFRKNVIERAEAEGLNPGTAATQFGHWKRDKGFN